MALKAVFRWENNDATRDLNAHFKAIFAEGVLSGGLIAPIAATLNVQLQPFEAVSRDGMLLSEDANVSFNAIPINQTTVITLLAVHNIGAAPTLTYAAYEISVFNALINKNDHIVFGEITLGALATQVTSADITYYQREQQDQIVRSHFRGKVTSSGLLPAASDTKNRAGDFYIITNGLGDLPELWGFNGVGWLNMTSTLSLAADLTAHRNNLFTNEKHLTDDEKDAALGTSGLPSIINRYVTSSDTRIPTQSENDALVGSNGSPSSTNKYITEEYPVAAPIRLSFPIPPGSVIQITNTDGPTYVGKGAIGSANRFFTILDFTQERGYLNSASLPSKVTGVFKDILLTIPLNPGTDVLVDADGFFTGNLYLQLDYAVDTAFRLLYGKRQLLKNVIRDFTISATPGMDTISNLLLEKISNIKGRPFDTATPTREQNINLRSTLDSISSYLGSVLETNIVAAKEDFEKLVNEPVIGADFEFNVGVPVTYYFQNTGLVSFTYSSSNGRVQYSSPVNLSSVQSGDVFVDGSGNKYLVNAVNDASDYVDIVSLETGNIPTSIVASVGSSSDGSVIANDNPRDLLLSEMKMHSGSDLIRISSITEKNDEFSKPDGMVAYGIKRHDNRFDPRIVLFGGFENYTTNTQFKYVRNAGDNGKIMITGFFTDVFVLMRRKQLGPILSVSIDGRSATLVNTTASGTINPTVAAVDTARFEKVQLVSGLSNTKPTTITVSIQTAGADSFDLSGFEVINNASTALLESGRAFEAAELVKRDTIDTAVSLSGTSLDNRGVRETFAAANNSHLFALSALSDLDSSGTPSGTIAGTSILISAGVPKLTGYAVGDLISISDNLLSIESIRKITGLSSPNITIDSSTPISGACIIRHICSTNTTKPIQEESQIARYDIINDFSDNTPSDFSTPDTEDRYVVHRDGMTVIAGTDISLVKTGITGASKAVQLESTGILSITAVCTRLDLIVVNSSPQIINVRIDGSNFYPITVGGNGAKRVTLFLNARYQSHIVEITGQFAFTHMILWGIKKPQFVGFPNELSEMQFLARYQPSRSILSVAPYTHPYGGAFFEAFKWGSYLNGSGINTDWSYALDFNKSIRNGQYIVSENDGATYEFYFFGKGFELQYFIGPDHGRFEVRLNGTLMHLTGYPINGTHVSSVVDADNVTYGLRNIGMYNLPLGVHKVTASIEVPASSSNAFFKFGICGYYIVNADPGVGATGTYSLGINREGYYNGSTDLRNFVPLNIPDKVAEISANNIRADEVSLAIGITSQLVTFNSPFADDNYVVNCVFQSSDSMPIYQPITIASQSSTGFTATWNYPIPDGTYKIYYTAIQKV